MKHVEVDWQYIKEKNDSGLNCTSYISTKWQFVDVLTKGFTSHQFQIITYKLGMDNIYPLTWGGALVDSK